MRTVLTLSLPPLPSLIHNNLLTAGHPAFIREDQYCTSKVDGSRISLFRSTLTQIPAPPLIHPTSRRRISHDDRDKPIITPALEPAARGQQLNMPHVPGHCSNQGLGKEGLVVQRNAGKGVERRS